MASSSARPDRRIQRSTRITVAIALIVVGAVVVAGAALANNFVFLLLAATLAVFLGAGAVRITHSEVIATRREWARDRAQQAQAYRTMAEQRSAEHGEVVDTLTSRIADRQHLVHELEGQLSHAQHEVAKTQLKVVAESRRARSAESSLTTVEARATQAETRANDADVRAADADERAAEAITVLAELEQQLDDAKTELATWEAAAATPERRRA